MGYMHRESSLSDNILVVDLGGQTLARITGIIWWEKGLLLPQSNKVRENFILCQVSDACLMICLKVPYCWYGDLHVFAPLSSSVLNRGKWTQASVSEGWTKWHYHAELYAYCSKPGSELLKVIRCGASGAEQEFNEFLLFVSAAKDLQILTLPWSCLIPCLNSTEILKGKSALVLFSENSSASQ